MFQNMGEYTTGQDRVGVGKLKACLIIWIFHAANTKAHYWA